ncbi:MAG TPA: DUF1259 domain-containing protein [Candidatus Acidoferrum sp.]|nr:DUF1259 domain-containing protein [Candidatus Acidoferrum sp.]
MKQIRLGGIFSLIALVLTTASLPAQEPPKEYLEVLTFLGRTGDFKAKVLKVNIPRNDLLVTILEQPAPTPFGFGGWVAMTRGDAGMEVLMGDLVLTQFEVNPVLSALLDHGIEVTALHNHFFFEEPRLYFMHIHGHGEALSLANAIKPALDLIGNVPPAAPGLKTKPPAATGTVSPFDATALNKIVGFEGEKLGAVYKFTAGRDDLHLTEMGASINARMGLNSWAAFAGSDSDAQIAGDIAMRESEVNSVLKALRSHDLNIVAIHNHMLGTQPLVIFLHYWGRGPSLKLAAGFRAALDVLGK